MRYILSLMFLFNTILSAQSPLLTLMGDEGVSYEAETISYVSRVETDGGTVISIEAVNNAILDAKSNGYYDSLLIWFAYDFGVKKNTNNKVTKLYDLSPNNNDASQADTSKSPTLYADSLHFDGGDYLALTSTIAASYTIVAVSNPYAGIFGRLIADDAGDNGMFALSDLLYYRFTDGANNTVAISGELFIACMVASNTDAFISFNGDNTQVGAGKSYIANINQIGASAGGQNWLGSIEEVLILSSKTQPPVVRVFLNSKYGIY